MFSMKQFCFCFFFRLLHSRQAQVVCMVLHRVGTIGEERKGANMEKEIQLPNQSPHEFDSINRGKMQYQTALKHLWLTNVFCD